MSHTHKHILRHMQIKYCDLLYQLPSLSISGRGKMSSPDRAMADWPMPEWGRKWSNSEIENAIYLAKKDTVFDIARLLGRSPDAVWKKLHSLGVKPHVDRWQNRSRRNGN